MRAFLIKSHWTLEGEFIPLRQTELELNTNKIFLEAPEIFTHVIDGDSPLKELSWESRDFEVVVSIEGVVEGTGNVTHSMTSYLAQDVLWGHKFYSLQSSRGGHWSKINLRRFNWTKRVQKVELLGEFK